MKKRERKRKNTIFDNSVSGMINMSAVTVLQYKYDKCLQRFSHMLKEQRATLKISTPQTDYLPSVFHVRHLV